MPHSLHKRDVNGYEFEQLQIQAFDLLQCLSCNPLKVAVHANCGFNHTSDLNFTLGPKTGHRFPLPVEVSLHVGESLDNRFDAMGFYITSAYRFASARSRALA